MKVVRTNLSGQLLRSEKEFYGGEISFFEKLRSNHGGSPKIIYHYGIPSFDDLDTEDPMEFTFANFDLLKRGVVIHANSNLRAACVGLKYTEVDSIVLTAYRIIKTLEGRITTIYRGVLEVKSQDGDIAAFTVLPSVFQTIKNYFGKGPLASEFHYVESEAPAERDNLDPALYRFLEIIDLMLGLK